MTYSLPVTPPALLGFALLGALAAGLAGCFDVSTGPCADFCDYICACDDGSDTASLSCADCRTIYTDDDAALQDECETELTDRQNADREAGIDCSGDTAAAQ
jgi:hypothetical protein